MLRGFVSVLALTVATAVSAAEQANPAHAIAQKFASPTESGGPAKSAVPQAQTAKSQPPEAVPAKTRSAPGATSAATAETRQPATSPKKPEPSKPEPSTPVPSQSVPKTSETSETAAAVTERPPLDYEMEMLRQARSEKAATPATNPLTAAPAAPGPSDKPAAAAAPPAPAVSAAAAAVAMPTAQTAAPVVAPPASPPPAVTAAPAAAPTMPTKTAEAAATPPATVPPLPEVKATDAKTPVDVKPVAAPVVAPLAPAGPTSPATLLLALETHSTTAKGRATQSSFDPIVCLNDTCFVSGGLQSDAIKIAKSDAIKLKTTEEASPASCKGMIACIFRNVAVPAGAQLQLIELGSASHDAARASDLKLDTSCRVAEGELACDEPIATPDFKLWVVPEETARAAGVQALEEAVADGLPHVDVARSTDK